MKELTERNFRREVLEEKKPVLVEFYAVWCGKCSMMEDVFERLGEEMEDEMKAGRVNTEQNPLLAARYRIRGIPAFLLFVNGKEVLRMTGMIEPQEMIDRLADVLRKADTGNKKKISKK